MLIGSEKMILHYIKLCIKNDTHKSCYLATTPSLDIEQVSFKQGFLKYLKLSPTTRTFNNAAICDALLSLAVNGYIIIYKSPYSDKIDFYLAPKGLSAVTDPDNDVELHYRVLSTGATKAEPVISDFFQLFE